MRILITGGGGFIGTKTIDRLLLEDNNHEITVLDNFIEQVHGREEPEYFDSVNYIIGDVADIDSWYEAIDKYDPEIIIHLASETGTGQSMEEISRYVKTNVLGTANMLEVLNTTSNSNSVKKVILSSSRSVYGDGENIETNSSLNPVSIYALTKLDQERLIELSCKVPYTIYRYQNAYGPGQSIKNPYTGIISIFSEKFSNGEDVDIWDNGEPTRDFVYVEDIVTATLSSINNKKTDYKTYNVGTGIAVPILEVTKKLRDLINPDSNINITDYHRPGDIMHAYGNINKINNELNWKPKFTLEQGLSEFARWFKEQKYENKLNTTR